MKKIIIIFIFMMFFTGCNASTNNNNKQYSGKVTDFSKQYLSTGYMINVYRSSKSLGDDYENYGKSYITMTFNVITDYISTTDYNAEASYNIKKKVVSNIHVIKTPKKGIANEIYGNYSINGGDLLVGTNNKYETSYPYPHNSGVQSSVAVTVNQIALYDMSTSPSAANGNQPTINDIYNELGIDLDSVTLTIGFRVELTTKDDRVLYKDYEVIVPPSGYNLTGSEFHMEYIETDASKMEPFLEKNA